MKKLFVVIVMAFTCVSAMSQIKNAEETLSNAELFSVKSGTLIEKQFIDIGKVKSVEVKVLKIKDLNDDKTISALRFEYEAVGKYSSDTKIAMLDIDEIEGLVISIKNIQSKVFPSTPETYTEVTYRSRSGFEAGAFYSDSKWKTYLKLEKYDSDSFVFLTQEDLTTLLGLIEQAKLKM